MPGRKHFGPAWSAQNDAANVCTIEIAQRLHQIVNKHFTQGIELAGVIELNNRDFLDDDHVDVLIRHNVLFIESNDAE